MRKLRIGIVLMLIGIGIPLTLMFFQEDGELFKLKAAKHDRLRAEEANTVNSIRELSRALGDIESLNSAMSKVAANPPEFLTDAQMDFETFMASSNLSETLAKAQKQIDYLLKEAYVPNSEQARAWTRISIEVGIPFKYSVGTGIAIFLVGLGFTVLALMGRSKPR